MLLILETRFPEFSDEAIYSDARVDLFISDSVLIIGDNENRWGGKYDVAQSYLTAHLLTVATDQAAVIHHLSLAQL